MLRKGNLINAPRANVHGGLFDCASVLCSPCKSWWVLDCTVVLIDSMQRGRTVCGNAHAPSCCWRMAVVSVAQSSVLLQAAGAQCARTPALCAQDGDRSHTLCQQRALGAWHGVGLGWVCLGCAEMWACHAVGCVPAPSNCINITRLLSLPKHVWPSTNPSPLNFQIRAPPPGLLPVRGPSCRRCSPSSTPTTCSWSCGSTH